MRAAAFAYAAWMRGAETGTGLRARYAIRGADSAYGPRIAYGAAEKRDEDRRREGSAAGQRARRLVNCAAKSNGIRPRARTVCTGNAFDLAACVRA
eukprot:1011088-Rhodomonas_salina.1